MVALALCFMLFTSLLFSAELLVDCRLIEAAGYDTLREEDAFEFVEIF